MKCRQCDSFPSPQRRLGDDHQPATTVVVHHCDDELAALIMKLAAIFSGPSHPEWRITSHEGKACDR